MKRISTLLLIMFFLSAAASAQVFWTEDFGSTCMFRAHADTYTGPNGAWTVTSTGTNAANANIWFINDRQAYNGIGVCSGGNDLGCAPVPNNSLHIGGAAFSLASVPEDSASYWTGYYCGLFGFCSTTNKRAESPVINCSGKSNITLAFAYYEGGDLQQGLLNGEATLWYYNGTAWSLLDSLAKTPRNCPNTMHGVFTSFSISLPASANNNPNVKIGFNWDNNDVSHGTDPSVAVDNITLSAVSGSLPVASFTASDTVFCDEAGKCINFTDNSANNPTSWQWLFPGATPNTSNIQNPINICYYTPGTYAVTLIVTNAAGKDTLAVTPLIVFGATPPVPTITVTGGDTLTSSPAAHYQWFLDGNAIPGATNATYVATTGGIYSVRITDNIGCSSISNGVTFTSVNSSPGNPSAINIYPNPSNGYITIQCSSLRDGETVTVVITNALGEVMKNDRMEWVKGLTLDVKSFESGIYFVHVKSDRGTWITSLIRD